MKRIALISLILLCAGILLKAQGIYGQRASLFEVLGTDSTQIVMLGNSITQGPEWSELFRNPKVINRGISGDRVDGVMKRIEAVTAGHPKKIFLMIGINDISNNLTAPEIGAKIALLADTIAALSPSTRLYVQSVLPVNNKFDRFHGLRGKEQEVRDLNAMLEKMCKEKELTFIDLYTPLSDADGNLDESYTNDGLHLLGNAYVVWRDILLPYMND